jgi:hypothetical protein
MSRRRCVVWTASLFGLVLGHVAVGATADIGLQSYVKGEAHYFALSLAPPAEFRSLATSASKPADIVVLFDTSASQVGKFREPFT